MELECLVAWNRLRWHVIEEGCLPLELNRRKIRLIEGNAKCRCLNNLPVKRLCDKCLSVKSPEPHTSPPPYTLYVYTVQREGREVEPERRLEWQQFTKIENTKMNDCISIL